MDAHSLYLILMRWVHFVAGVIWIGHLYFFNLVNVNFMKSIDAATKSKVVPQLMPRALWWFRWGAVVTVLAGILLTLDAIQSGGFTGSYAVSVSIGGGLGIIMMLNVWAIIWPNQKKVIQATIEAAEKGAAPPPEMAVWARRAYLASRANFYLSFPMLFFMGTASHFPFLGN